MDSAPPHGQQKVRPALKWAFLLMVALFVGVLWWQGMSRPTRIVPDSCVPVRSCSSRREAPTNAWKPTAVVRTEANAEEPTRPAPSDTATEPSILTIKCVNTRGESVEGVGVFCRVTEYIEKPKKRINQTQATRKTDKSGEIRLTAPANAEARLEPDDSHWYFKIVEKASFAQCDPVLLVLSPKAALRLRCQYADGLPVTDSIYIWSDEPADRWDGGLSADGTVTFTVPIDRPLKCKVITWRVGFEHTGTQISAEELASGKELLIIVPVENRPVGGIRVVFPEGGSPEAGNLILESLWGPSLHPFEVRQTAIEIPRLMPGKGYRASICGCGTRAWRSAWVEVKSKEATVLTVVWEQGAVVRARLLGPDGNPMKLGAIRLPYGDYLGFDKQRPEAPREQWADEAGNVVISGLPSGESQIEFEAWGMEPQSRVVNLKAGEELDLGTIFLSEAVGEVEVNLVGMQEGKAYAVYVGRPTNGGCIYWPLIPVVDGRATIKRLALRSYSIGAIFAKGGTCIAKLVELTTSQPMTSITLDVSNLKP